MWEEGRERGRWEMEGGRKGEERGDKLERKLKELGRFTPCMVSNIKTTLLCMFTI